MSSLSGISIVRPSRCGLLSGLAVTGAVYYASQPSLFTLTHAGAADRLDTARSRCLQR